MREYAMGELPRDVVEKVKPTKRSVRVPPLVPVDTKDVKERYTLEDASRHARMIRDAWAKAGHEVEVRVEKFTAGNRPAYRVITPGLVNGLPIKAIQAMREER